MPYRAEAIDFVTFAADNYANWIELWLSSANRSNPDSRLFVYDVSPQPSAALKQLAATYPNAEAIHWPEASWQFPAWVGETDFRFFWPGFGLADELKSWSRRLRFKLTGRKKQDWMIDKKQFVAAKQFFIRICCQKPYIIRDAWDRTERALAYVDADAVVLNRFRGYPGGASDFTVTVVDRDQLRIGGEWEPMGPDGPIPVSVINAGVMFANHTAAARNLIDAWIAEMSRVKHGSSDQSALANLVHRHDATFHETMLAVRVVTKDGDATVASLPCARYNQVRIPRDGRGIGKDVAVAHFVGSWKQREHWQTVTATIRQAWLERGLINQESEK
jgi:hypothetical protein